MELWTILLTILLIVFVYYYFSNKRNYFDEHGIIHVKPNSFVRNVVSALFPRVSITEGFQNIYNLNKDAKYVGFFEFNTPIIVIRDLELAKNITVKYFDHFVNHRGLVDPIEEPLFGNNLFSLRDNKWREIRNLLTPAFTSSKMKGMFILMSECANNFANYFLEKSQNEPYEVNSKDAFTRYTNDVIGTCAFGIQVDSMRYQNNDFYRLGRKATNLEGFLSIKFFLVRNFPKISKLFNIKIVTEDVEKFFTEIVEDTIATRDEKDIVRPDMLQLMMETRNHGDGKGRILTIREMTAHAFGFFFGGFDTSSSLMCFVAHLIAANEDIQMKLREEVDDAFEKCNGDPTYEAVNSMVYLDAVINETLRMYPIVAFLDRVCNTEFELPPALPGKKPVLLKPGDNIWIPVYSLQRDPKYYENPDVFNPERFLSNDKVSVNPALLHLSFGQGPRMCIGNRFALLETKILLAHILHKCLIKPGKAMITPLQLSTSTFAMTAQGGFWLQFQPREK